MPDNYKVELRCLQECGLSQLEALAILALKLEYQKPNHGKWNGNT